MSIASEIARLRGVKADILQAISDKGVMVPAGSALDDCPGLIASITTGGEYIPGTVLIGGKNYKTTTFNGKTWLAENLDYLFSGCSYNQTFNDVSAVYYDNDEQNYKKHGLLYTFFAAEYLEQNKNDLLPDGWRVANKTDYFSLMNDLVVGSTYIGLLLKAKDYEVDNNCPVDWNGANYYGFSAIPGGYRDGYNFKAINTDSDLWTPNSSGSNGTVFYFRKNNSSLAYLDISKDQWYNLRLVKDSA